MTGNGRADGVALPPCNRKLVETGFAGWPLGGRAAHFCRRPQQLRGIHAGKAFGHLPADAKAMDGGLQVFHDHLPCEQQVGEMGFIYFFVRMGVMHDFSVGLFWETGRILPREYERKISGARQWESGFNYGRHSGKTVRQWPQNFNAPEIFGAYDGVQSDPAGSQTGETGADADMSKENNHPCIPMANIANCRAKVLGKSNLVTCMTDAELCGWRQFIRNSAFCAHTLNFMIAQATLPDGHSMSPAQACCSEACC